MRRVTHAFTFDSQPTAEDVFRLLQTVTDNEFAMGLPWSREDALLYNQGGWVMSIQEPDLDFLLVGVVQPWRVSFSKDYDE